MHYRMSKKVAGKIRESIVQRWQTARETGNLNGTCALCLTFNHHCTKCPLSAYNKRTGYTCGGGYDAWTSDGNAESMLKAVEELTALEIQEHFNKMTCEARASGIGLLMQNGYKWADGGKSSVKP